MRPVIFVSYFILFGLGIRPRYNRNRTGSYGSWLPTSEQRWLVGGNVVKCQSFELKYLCDFMCVLWTASVVITSIESLIVPFYWLTVNRHMHDMRNKRAVKTKASNHESICSIVYYLSYFYIQETKLQLLINIKY